MTGPWTRRTAATMLLWGIAVGMLSRAGSADEPAPARREANELLATARKTYALLLAQYRAGEVTGPLRVELLNNWSKRIMLAETQSFAAGASRAQLLTQAYNKHIARTHELEKVARKLAAAGKATAAEVAATKFFRLEGDALLAKIVQERKRIEEVDLNVILPSASEARPLVNKPKEIFIHISREGNYRIAGKQVDLKQLQSMLTKASAANPGNQSVIIRADKGALWKSVVVVMNACNVANITDYRVAIVSDK